MEDDIVFGAVEVFKQGEQLFNKLQEKLEKEIKLPSTMMLVPYKLMDTGYVITIINKNHNKRDLSVRISKDNTNNKLQLDFKTLIENYDESNYAIDDCYESDYSSDSMNILEGSNYTSCIMDIESKLFSLDNIDLAVDYIFECIKIYVKFNDFNGNLSYKFISNIKKDDFQELLDSLNDTYNDCHFENILIFKDEINNIETKLNEHMGEFYLTFYRVFDNNLFFLGNEKVVVRLEDGEDELMNLLKDKTQNKIIAEEIKKFDLEFFSNKKISI